MRNVSIHIFLVLIASDLITTRSLIADVSLFQFARFAIWPWECHFCSSLHLSHLLACWSLLFFCFVYINISSFTVMMLRFIGETSWANIQVGAAHVCGMKTSRRRCFFVISDSCDLSRWLLYKFIGCQHKQSMCNINSSSSVSHLSRTITVTFGKCQQRTVQNRK